MTEGQNVARRRVNFACEMCRSRRTKCDGRKPTCSFCESHEIQCVYLNSTAPVSRHDAEIAAIKEDLDRLCGLLSIGLVGQERRIFEDPPPGYLPELPPLREYPLDESIISRHWRREFPFMTIQTPSMLCLLELNPKLASQIVARERTENLMVTPSSELFEFGFQYEHAIMAFEAFYDRIYHWYPILPAETFNYYREAISGLLIPSSGSFLVLLVAAIGSIARCPSLTTAYELRPDAHYINKALPMLPSVLADFSLASVQCLVLLSIYYSFMAKPCQAHDFILIASSKAQAMLKCRLFDDDENKIDLLRRSFWSILLIETELAYHIDMPESNIWKFDDRILLPALLTSCQPCREDQVILFHSMPSNGAFGMSSDTAKAYFLAQITMARMTRRCTTSVIVSQAKQIYSPIIALELTYQLKTWYTHLPPNIRFEFRDTAAVLSDDFLEVIGSSRASGVTAVTQFLQMQYYLCLTNIYWPAVYSVINTGTLTDLPTENCTQFFESYVGFVMTAATVIHNCPQNPWSIYASLFITTMACFKGASSLCLQSTVTPGVARCFTIAARLFETGDAVAVSPAIREIGSILRLRLADYVG